MFFGSGTKSLFQLWSVNSLKTNFYLFFFNRKNCDAVAVMNPNNPKKIFTKTI